MQFFKKKIKNINGLQFYILTTVPKVNKKSILFKNILLLHGFPELSYSFRYIMKDLTKAGFACIAPDQRGYGNTIFENKKEMKPQKFSVINLVKDIYILLNTLSIGKVHIIGHDFGAYIASYFALVYPKKVSSIILMSMPFSGIPTNLKNHNKLAIINRSLAKLKPKRKHYQVYFSKNSSHKHLENPKKEVFDFLKRYFFYKSHNYVLNKPFKLKKFSAKFLSIMPEYYIMKYHLNMSETVKNISITKEENKQFSKWMTIKDLKIFSKNFETSGFKYSLLWYKVMLSKIERKKIISMQLPKTICIPTLFISGKSDWGPYQKPGDLEKMKNKIFSNFYGIKLIDNAGHWVQQENPKDTVKEILFFYKKLNHYL